MSNVIDRRVVEMGFDNKQFEHGIKTSVHSLNELKKGLNLDDAARSLKGLADTARSFSLGGLNSITENIQKMSSGFSSLGIIGITTLMNLTNSVVNFGKKMIESMTIQPLKQGLQEYETQINSIQTVLANTESKGTTLEQVNDALDRLNEYSDKTIYNFTEMTRNIGTFTAAGVDLETSVQAIKGIANLAAVSGSNSQQASTAMYQLSQALASGTVKLMDWNSVVNAGMGGQVFQDALKETARVHGVAIDDMITKEGSFRETLSNGWLTSEILTETLSKFTGDLTADQLKTMGYTEDQIKGILRLGEMANDAATKVKTFTQLTETAKEAIQSGWAQSWRYVIGDFEEAKALWTEVSDIIGGFISASSESRLTMLKEWKDLGGRTEMLEAARKAFESIMSIVTPIKEAFSEIFPQTTGKQLYDITMTVKELATRIKIGAETADKLKRAFKGVAAVFDIVLFGVRTLASELFKFAKAKMPTDTGVLDWFARVGDSIVKFRDAIKAGQKITISLDQIKSFLSKAAESAKSFLSSLGDRFPQITTTVSFLSINIGKLVSKIKESFPVVGKIVDFLADKFDRVRQFVSEKYSIDNLKDFANFLKVKFEPLTFVFEKVKSTIKTMYEATKVAAPLMIRFAIAVGKMFGKLGGAIWDAVDGINFEGVLDVVNGGLLAGLLMALKTFVGKGSGTVDGVTDLIGEMKGTFSGIKGILDGVRGSLETWQANLQAKTLMTIAMAIGILAISLIAISMIDGEKLTKALTAITVMFTQLLGAMAVFNKIQIPGAIGGGIGAAATALLVMAASILVLAGAVTMLSKLEPKELVRGIFGIQALTATIVIFAKAISVSTTNLLSGSIGLLVFTFALKTMVSAVERLAALNIEALKAGLIAVGTLFTELALFMKMTELNGMGAVKSVGLLILAGAMVVMAVAVERLANIDPANIAKGVIALGIILAEIGAFINLTGNGLNMIPISVGLMLMSTSILILSEAVSKLGTMTWEEVSRGLISMATALGIVFAAVKILPPNMIFVGVSLGVVAAALLILSEAMKSFGSMSWEDIVQGITALGLSLIIMAGVMYVLQGSIAGAAALVIMAGAIAVLAPALKVLGSLSFQEIGLGLLALVGAFTVLGLAGLVLTPLIPTLLALSGAMFLFGIAVLSLGAGILMLSAGMAALAISGAAGAAALVVMASTLIGLIPMIIIELVEAVLTFIKLIAESAPVIYEAFKALLLGLLDVIIDISPSLFEAVSLLLTKLVGLLITFVPMFVDATIHIVKSMITSIAERMPEMMDSGFKIITAFLEGIKNNIGKVVTTAIEIVEEFLDAISSKIPDVIASGWELVISLIDGMAEGIEEYTPQLREAVIRLAVAVIDALTGGLLGGIDAVVETVKELGSAALGTLADIFNWPTGAGIAQGFGAGFTQGISEFANGVGDTMSGLGDSISNGLSGAAGLIPESVDMNPTITPVVDLSKVEQGAARIDSMFGTQSLDVSASSRKARDATSTPTDVGTSGGQTTSSNGEMNVEFNQYNYSPEALKRVDIYRQTNNQLKTFKKAIETP